MDPLAELRSLIARHADNPEAREALPSVIVASSPVKTYSLGLIAEPTLAVVAQGAKRAVLGDRIHDYAAGQYLIWSVDLPLTANVIQASVAAPFLGFGLRLKPASIAALLLESGVSAPGKIDPPGIAVSDLTTDLIDPIVRLLRLLDHLDDIPVLAPAIEREILWRLLHGAQGAMVQQLGRADSRLAQVARAIRWIRAHYAESFRVDDLAQVAGMSVTSLHRHFRSTTSLTPIQYQKQIRLQEARAQLLANPGAVASVGFNVGYDSPSQFSREYRRLFGAPPGQDAARLTR